MLESLAAPPTHAFPRCRYSMQQRYMLGLAVAITFAIQLFYQVYIKNRHNYHSLAQLRRFPYHFGVLLARLLLLGGSVAVCSVELRPCDHVGLQAVFSVLQVTAVRAQKVSFPISSDRQHPVDSQLANAFDSIRLKALRYRNRRSLADVQHTSRLSRRNSSTTIQSMAWAEESARLGPMARWMRNSNEANKEKARAGQQPASTGQRPASTDQQPASDAKSATAWQESPLGPQAQWMMNSNKSENANTSQQPASTDHQPASTDQQPRSTDQQAASDAVLPYDVESPFEPSSLQESDMELEPIADGMADDMADTADVMADEMADTRS